MEMESTTEGTAITRSIFLGFSFRRSLGFCFLRWLFVFSLVVGAVVVVIVRVGVCRATRLVGVAWRAVVGH